MDSHFKVTFIETYGDSENKIECEHFHEKTSQYFLVDEIKLMENSELRVIFEAPMGYKLYIDGLDQLDEQIVHEDGRGVFIQPSKTPIVLYNPTVNNKPYPFMPGTYFLMVITPEGNELEARAKVLTKRITEDQHVIMVEEIEKAVKGLSGELARRRKVYNEAAFDIFGPKKINEYSIILSNKEKIISGLHTIDKNRRYSVIKTYPVIPRSKAKKIDGKSIKYVMMHPEQQKTIQAPVSKVTYSILENSWLKSIVVVLLKYVTDMKACFRHPYSATYNVQQARLLEKELVVLQNQLTIFLNERWVRDIPEISSGKVPMAFFTVGTYTVFYKIYRMLKQSPQQKTAEPKLQFHYKRSDLLYEIWGYLTIVNIFKEQFGFSIQKNWLQIDQHTLDQAIVPKKHESDYVELVRENYTIRIFYDEIIPKQREYVSPLRTMFTMDNNKPDCRIDIWVDAQFKGSLIVDFKYRKKEYLWNADNLKDGRQPSKVMKQLASYSRGMASHTLTLNGEKNPLIDVQPVTEVWAVYPIKGDARQANYEPNDYSVRLIDLSPGSDCQHFIEMLKKAVDEIIKR
ncbi:DUF2357 domain-containing protein [Sporosarcina sp. YIM B06819]|uniref:DUF2357 domain-containing protein n=1 Tax=Sporosarcina sp. YIM B06819 TaxID=3081769 RepID=UPI00298BFE47|nr:DUF2357 domain-containing protein [Sporosarcina sp. YIM B06819]